MAVTATTGSVGRAGVSVSVARMGRDYASIGRTDAALMSKSTDRAEPGERSLEERHILAVRVGHGANCSSIGSVVDTLFASAVVGAMVFAAVSAAMKSERVTIAGAPRREPPPPRSDDGPGTARSA
jgi:hypothetical protein